MCIDQVLVYGFKTFIKKEGKNIMFLNTYQNAVKSQSSLLTCSDAHDEGYNVTTRIHTDLVA
jgi:hypothetical protein